MAEAARQAPAGLAPTLVGVMGVTFEAFADGALFGLLGWLLAAAFDAYHLAGQMVGVFAMLTALTVIHRPPPALLLWRRTEEDARPAGR